MNNENFTSTGYCLELMLYRHISMHRITTVSDPGGDWIRRGVAAVVLSVVTGSLHMHLLFFSNLGIVPSVRRFGRNCGGDIGGFLLFCALSSDLSVKRVFFF